ncbi:fibronectin, type III domain containing protein [Clostridium aceticum]|uniref:Fibronectin, type III domain containing protein n=1 Tax=Clostridium aceticum TaxID=84022 RepID=A0A0D8IDE9_9CLOT|nr:IPT/TIG domain-containing protein [Clostridium aceticum]AKL93641.1 fibronectin, type III domain containing protein [Clostridium aceticum]KJF27221.1 hypothetical protein TZ02_09145 [Clostridium aceticum]
MKRKIRQKISVLIMVIMIVTQLVTVANAIDVGGGAEVTAIKYQVVRDSNYNITQALVEIRGENLVNPVVLFSTNDGTKQMGKITLNLSSFIQYSFTPEEVDSFTGGIIIGNKEFNLGLGSFPTIDATTKIVNISEEDTLVINGRNLNQFKEEENFIIKGEYGKAGQFKEFGEGNSDPERIVIDKATPPGERGLQNIRIIKEKKSGVTMDPEIVVEYNYNNIFSFVSDLNISDMEMYPNIGARGDLLYIRSEDFTKPYDVYFFSVANASAESFSPTNKAVPVGFEVKSSINPKALLTVEVPQGVSLGSHYVILAETINGQVVAQQMIMKDATNPAIYTVVDATNRARITNVHPAKGPDIGGTPVGIEGRNILSSSISPSELVINYAADKRTVVLSPNKQEIIITYNDATYQEQPVTVERRIKVQIGGIATFEETADGRPRVEIGANDKLYVVTPKVDDAATNPDKEVLAEIRTVIKENNTGGNEYIFQEVARWNNKFIYEASSILPIVETVTPSKVQLDGDRLKEDTLVSIRGKNFMVNRYINSQGQTIVNYPKILMKTANDTDIHNYELMLQKQIVGGTVTAKVSWRSASGIIEQDEGVEILVLDDFDRIVDGTTGRDVGTRIVMKIPKDVVASIGMKNVQVTNPTRGSQEAGLSDIQLDKIEFVTAADNPYIDEVVPNIVTVDGGQDIEVRGSNFLEGVKVFIDGKEVTGVSREIATGGNKFLLKFKAPKGREGVTQLMVMNPSGAMAAAEFVYVDTLDKDPKITSFAPNKGSNGTLVVVNGDNFLKPDSTTKDISGNGIYRLIGTRILLDGQDINSYYREGSNIALQNYTAPAGEQYQLIQRDGVQGVKFANYYHSVLLHDEASNQYYTLDINAAGNLILSDGVQNTYRIVQAVDGQQSRFVATKGGAEYRIEVGKQAGASDILTITRGAEETVLKVKTPYAIENNIIIGNRVQVLTKNQILFTVPQLGVEKWYNLSVQNPDTKIDTRTGQNGFYYFKQPQRNPIITTVTPPQGSTEGGYAVDIEGQDFQDFGGAQKSRVYVGGVEVPATDVSVSTDGRKITIIMPRYPGDLKVEVENGRKTVPVVVVNIDGGNANKPDGFTYVIPTSNPTINRITPNKGNAAGGETVRIWGTDFRFFEPYEDANGNAKYDLGEKFQDLNDNGKWDNIEGMDIAELSAADKKILPMVYFGKHRAEILEFSQGYLVVSLPTGSKGVVDVFVVNNDFGTSNKMKFTYEASSPRVTNIIPPEGNKSGKVKTEINGSDFSSSILHIYNQKTENELQQYDVIEMPLVHFGDVKNPMISNRSIDVSALNGGSIVNGRASVDVGNITVDYQSTANSTKVILQMTEGGEVYTFQVNGYDNTIKYIDTATLKNSNGKASDNSYELVRLEVDPVERKLIVERGYTPFHPNASMTSGQIVLYTPSYYTIGRVPVTIKNPDGSSAQVQYEYKNPDSNPKITNVTKEGESPVLTTIDGKEVRVLRMTHKGGSIVSIIGEDFRENAEIYISNIAHITQRSNNKLEHNSSTQMTFEMPNVGENAVGRLHRVIVKNYDGASATSDELTPPIYIEFVKGESDPALGGIEPNKGLVTGGTRVKITGNDFRKSMEGFEGEVLKVFFGETAVVYQEGNSRLDIEDYRTLHVTVPAGTKPGVVPVRVENPDGSLGAPPLQFTYISKPKIDSIDPEWIFTNDTTTEITLAGEMFMSGAKVILGGRIVEGGTTNSEDTVLAEGIVRVRDGKNIDASVVGGVTAASVTVVDDKTITVRFNEALGLQNNDIIVVNPDGGISEPYKGFKYQTPIPDKPLVLEAIPGFESTMQLIWSKSAPEVLNAADKYEVYAKRSSDRNYSFIADTRDAEFLVRGLEPDTRYDFMVRALNSYGSALEFAEVSARTLRLSEDDKLKDKLQELDKEENKLNYEGKEEVINGALVKTIGSRQIPTGTGSHTIDFSLSQYSSHNKFIVAIPVSLLSTLDRNIVITDGNANFSFPAKSLYTREVIQGSAGNLEDAYVRITFERVAGQEAQGLYSAVSRTQRRASNIYGIDFDLQVGKTTTAIRQMLQNGNLAINFDARAYSNVDAAKLFIGKYDPSKHEFTRQRSSSATTTQEPGRFMLLADR